MTQHRGYLTGLLLTAALAGVGCKRSEPVAPKPPAPKPAAPPVVVAPSAKPQAAAPEADAYAWVERYHPSQSIALRIAPPEGFARVDVEPGTFAHWLRYLPLKPGRPDVRLFNGEPKANQTAHHAVIDIDVGERDLQQCADAVMRLRAEYLFTHGHADRIAFNYTSGDRAAYTEWAEGMRPSVSGNRVTWSRSAGVDRSYRGFRRYLRNVFIYAGTASLSKELPKLGDPARLRAGDVIVQGGYPGHAVIVVDAAVDARTGRRVYLLAQSYMPAQDMHVLVNPSDPALSPWYTAEPGRPIVTPEWRFNASHLRRFPPPR